MKASFFLALTLALAAPSALALTPLDATAFAEDATIGFGSVDGAVSTRYASRGVVFHQTRTLRSHWALSGAKLAGNGPPGGWGDKAMSISFVKPGSYIPATVQRVGLYVAGESASVTLTFFDSSGQTLGTREVANGMGADAKRWRGFTDTAGIARVEVTSASYGIDSLRFDTPLASEPAGAAAAMVGAAAFSDSDRSVTFDGIGGPTTYTTVASHYAARGVTFASAAYTLPHPWALSPGHMVSSAAGKLGAAPLSFAFRAADGTKAYVSRVGFYVAGEAERVIVTLRDVEGDVLAIYKLVCGGGRDTDRFYGFHGVGIHSVTVASENVQSGFGMDNLRFDAPRSEHSAELDAVTAAPDADDAQVLLGAHLKANQLVGNRFVRTGLVFSEDARAIATPAASGRPVMAAGAPRDATWGSTSMALSFVLPGSLVPATAARAGMRVAGASGTALIQVLDQAGDIITTHRVENLTPAGSFVGFQSKEGIASVRIVGASYAVDDVRFGGLGGFTNGQAQMVQESALDGHHVDLVGFDSIGDVGVAVADTYKRRGIVFSAATTTMASAWARSKLMARAGDDVGQWGNQPMSFHFVLPHSNDKATVDAVGFYIAGHSATATVEVLGLDGKVLGTFDIANGQSKDGRRWYGFRASGIAKVQISSSSYAIDSVKFDAPLGEPQDCKLGAWTKLSVCSHTCGTGYRTRSRVVEQAPKFGGALCATTTDSQTCNAHACPIDCVLGDYSAWSTCSLSCGSGSQKRRRSVRRAPTFGGFACAKLEEQQSCNVEDCPTDCTMGAWSSWSQCSVTCGGSMQHRDRSASQVGAGGKTCPHRAETRDCNVAACAIDCALAEWASWGTCSVSCGGGHRERKRAVTTAGAHGGKPCLHEHLFQHQHCNENACPIDCKPTVWDKWEPCSVSCGGSEHTRHRSVAIAAALGGKACPALQEARPCNAHHCPLDCAHSEFSDWTPCDKSCATGKSIRTRTTEQPRHGGASCAHTREERPCNEHACPVDCVVHKFTPWTTCTHSCGAEGLQTRYRPVDEPAMGGQKCPTLAVRTESRSCNDHKCPVDCKLDAWQDWSVCTMSCNAGSQKRVRAIVTPPQAGGEACIHMSETRACNLQSCPVNCITTPWSPWSPCSRSCGSGSQGRGRSTPRLAAYGGVACPTLLAQTRTCNAQPCPVDCVVRADFDKWSPCTKSCGAGSQRRSRPVTAPNRYGGKACAHQKETRRCNEHACAVDCVLSDWGSWGDCSVGCGTGKQERTRNVAVEPSFGGVECPASNLFKEAKNCNTDPCAIDCTVAPWQKWTACTRTCGTGVQHRIRDVLESHAHGGKFCPETAHARRCNTKPCATDCVLEAWGGWADCSVTCGGGVHTRTRELITPPSNGGKTCDDAEQSRSCNNFPCAVDCVVSAFSLWTACSRTCGAGITVRTRSIITPVRSAGRLCPALQQTHQCNVVPCPVDCEVSLWSVWSECTKSCGSTGTKRRTRYATTNVKGGAACPSLTDVADCNMGPCGVNCVVSNWQAWSTCTKSCGTGTKSRARTVVGKPAGPGIQCPLLAQTRGCNAHRCPVDCVKEDVGDIGLWSTCTTTCGPGTQTRMGKIARPATYGGKSCGSLAETRTCFHATCPTDCVVAEWGTWGTCSASCGSGQHARFRTVTTQPDTHGKKCPPLHAVQECKMGPCPVHCSVGGWGRYGACSASCGSTGTQQRTRSVISHADHGGFVCPNLSEEQPCNRHTCPVNCIVTEWGSWSGCSATCGAGLLTRKRQLWAAATNGGKDCPMLTDQKACTSGPCAIDCAVASWASFTPCSNSCGGGKKVRMRWVTRQAHHAGTVCPTLKEERDCNEHHCPIDCVMSEWKVWGECTATCDTGTRSRSRDVSVPANLGGKACSPIVSQTSSCFRGPCPQECKVSAWGAWGECSKPCGIGFRVRTRSVLQIGIHHECPWLSATERCNAFSCTPPTPIVDNPIYMWGGSDWVFKPTPAPTPGATPDHCLVGPWGSWTGCTTSCGPGVKSRVRVNVDPIVGGQVCPHRSESQTCSVKPCGHEATDCKWGTGASEAWVTNGWMGNGWGENSCAPCQCLNGEMKCGHRKKTCSNLAKLKMCSAKTTCSFEFNYKAGHNVMVTHVKPGEKMGSQHHCAFNFKSRACECRCWGAVQTMIWDDSNVVTTKKKVVLPEDDGAAPLIVDQKTFREVPVMAPSFLLTASNL